MPQPLSRNQRTSERIMGEHDCGEIRDRLAPKLPADHPLPKHMPSANAYSAEGLKARQEFLAANGIDVTALKALPPGAKPEDLQGNIENWVGFCSVPVGVIGPLRINGLQANGDFFVPLATTEGAMVASYNRGAYVLSLAGGATTACLAEGISRAPCFLFESIVDAGIFADWVCRQADSFQQYVSQTTRHGQLIEVKTCINGSSVYLILEYTTGDAAGQNMITVATEAVCREILKQTPIAPRTWYLEGNLSGDKKACMMSFLGVRGKKVLAEACIPRKLVKRFLHSTPEDMSQYCKTSTLGGIQSGGIGVQGHFANALAGLFIACGQDAACVSEASVGMTDMEVNGKGELHVSVSLPNLTVGTVGGGAHLPTARACLEMMDCYGEGKARKFAEICAATVMAGEVSIIAALAAGDFGQAHASYRHQAD